MNPLQLTFLELKRLFHSRFARIAVIGVLLIPLLYSYLYLYAFWDPYGKLQAMQVAVVNEDVGAKVDGMSIHGGNELVNTLRLDHTVGWVFTSAANAQQGLASERFDLALVIPRQFSEEIAKETSISHPSVKSGTAQLLYYSNPSNNFLAEQVGNKVMAVLNGKVNSQIGAQFVEQIFNKTTSMISPLKSAVSGSQKITQGLQNAGFGASQLHQGIQQAASGSGSLVNGLIQLVAGAGNLTNGTTTFAKDSTHFAAGMTSLSSGIQQTDTGATKLYRGTVELHQGLLQAESKLASAAQGSQSIADGAAAINTGAMQIASGNESASASASKLATGATSLHQGLQSAGAALANSATGASNIASGLSQVEQGVKQAANGIMQTSAGIDQASQSLGQMSTSISQGLEPGMATDSQSLVQAESALQSLAIANPTLANTPAYEQTLATIQAVQASLDPNGTSSSNLYAGMNQLQSGLAQVEQGLSGTSTSGNPSATSALTQIASSMEGSPTSTSLSTRAGGANQAGHGASNLQTAMQQLESGSSQLAQGLSSGQTQFNQLTSGAATMASDLQQLANGETRLASGANHLAIGAHNLTNGATALSSGLTSGNQSFSQLVTGAATLSNGLSTFQQGTGKLATGAKQLQNAATSLANGATAINHGSLQLSSGIQKAASGASALHQGLTHLTSGSSQLQSGLDELQSGSATLHQGLQSGYHTLARNMPSQPNQLANAMTNAVTVHETQTHPVSNYGTGFTPYFVPLALWVGALIQFFIINLKDNRWIALGVHPVTVTLGKWGTFAVLGSIQSLISSAVLILVLHLHPVHMVGFFLFNVLLSWSFTAILFVLAQLFGMAGRFLGLVLLMLQLTSCAGTFPLELVPGFFRAINPYLPMTYGTAGLRQLVSGSANLSLATSVWTLVGFTAGALLIGILTSARFIHAKDLAPAEIGAEA